MSTAPAATWSARSPPTCSRSPRTTAAPPSCSTPFATSRATWNLPREGQAVTASRTRHLAARPAARTGGFPAGIWAAEQRWLDALTDEGACDWRRAREAWYFQAYARDHPPHRCSPPNRRRSCSTSARWRATSAMPDSCSWCATPTRSARASAGPARAPRPGPGSRPATCPRPLRFTSPPAWPGSAATSRRTASAGSSSPTRRCARSPSGWRTRFRALVPALDDLNLRRRLAVKRYDEMLTDMNARHIARLDAEQLAAFNRVFRRHRDVLDYFGYDIVDGGGAARPDWCVTHADSDHALRAAAGRGAVSRPAATGGSACWNLGVYESGLYVSFSSCSV